MGGVVLGIRMGWSMAVFGARGPGALGLVRVRPGGLRSYGLRALRGVRVVGWRRRGGRDRRGGLLGGAAGPWRGVWRLAMVSHAWGLSAFPDPCTHVETFVSSTRSL